MANPLATDLRRRANPAALAEPLGIELDTWQRQILSTDRPTLVLACRQAGKTFAASLALIHAALYEPDSTCLCVSVGLRQSGLLFAKCLAAYKGLGRPVVSESESALQLRLQNGSRIVALPGSGEATVRGYSPRVIVLDEAARLPDLTMAALRPSLAVSGGRLLAISSPAGRRGWMFDAWESEEDWLRIRVPAWEIPRISPDYLESEKLALGPLFDQEFGAQFVQADQQYFSSETVRRIFAAGESIPPERGEQIA